MALTLKNPELGIQGIESFEGSKTNMQHTFTDQTAFLQLLKTQQQDLLAEKTREQFLIVKSVLEAEFPRLADGATKLPSRLSYHRKTGTLIAKIIPGLYRDFAVETFRGSIGTQINLMGLRWEMDTSITPTISIGDWYRVADCCWSPAGQNPSLFLEVGLLESSGRLASTAKGWLEIPGSTVQMVVTIDINKDEARVLITLWELGTTFAQPPSTRRAATIEIFRLNDKTVVVGDDCYNSPDEEESIPITDLVLPFEKVVGRPSEEWLERDFRVHKVELEHLAEGIWQRQGFISA
ncbi:hypothetical protein SI65_07789 [Aspergillus cristatus]|uniref:Uncharacterized protein n=1 Tax=Aspergillus cristatus TaxID=573508 RepID=A0A1E3B7C4_ASPCR|nr:hypothetical protein SI65_07789 [Aspergillus cristatus]